MAKSWVIKRRTGWTVTGSGWAALLVLACLLVASLMLLHGIARVMLTSLLIMFFLAFAVAKIDLRKLDVG